MIKIPFKERGWHMMCGAMAFCGIDRLVMMIAPKVWLSGTIGRYLGGSYWDFVYGILCVFFAFFFSYVLREHKGS